MSGIPPIKSGSIRETVNAFLAGEEDSQVDTEEKEPSVTSYTTEYSLSMDISDTTRNTKGAEKMSRTGSVVSTENSFSVLEDIRNYSKPMNAMLSAENLSTMAAIDSMVMDSQGKLIPRDISEDDALSLSTDHSFSGMPTKQRQPKPQVTKILVLEKEVHKKKKPSQDFPIAERRRKSSGQNLNPHIVLVEPEHSTGGESSEQEIDSHIPPTRRESAGSLDQHLQVDSRKRAKSFPYEEVEHGLTPLTLSPTRSPTLTPLLSPVVEEAENGKLAGFKKFALLKLKARKWMKRSGISTEMIPVNHEQQNQRPLLEIPRALKLEVWKEAHPIVQRMCESYMDSLGEHDPLTNMASLHLATHKANFEGTS